MKKLFMTLGVILTFSISIVAHAKVEVKNLRTEYMRNPVGIDVKIPHINWVINANKRGSKQIAYKIIVSTNKDGSCPIWNSGKIKSDKSVNNLYMGRELAPSTLYYWHVCIWNNNNATIFSTENAFFETGLLNSGWGEAKWIKATALKQGESIHTTNTTSAKFTLKTKMTILKQNSNIIFAAKDVNNMYMWSINAKDQTYPFIRRHVFTANTAVVTDTPIGTYYIKADLIGTERHLKIDVDNNVIKTYIDGVLVDTYNDTSGNLKS
jgi:alpha-L-rhamnosidase